MSCLEFAKILGGHNKSGRGLKATLCPFPEDRRHHGVSRGQLLWLQLARNMERRKGVRDCGLGFLHTLSNAKDPLSHLKSHTFSEQQAKPLPVPRQQGELGLLDQPTSKNASSSCRLYCHSIFRLHRFQALLKVTQEVGRVW